jgi:hypothetical protein
MPRKALPKPTEVLLSKATAEQLREEFDRRGYEKTFESFSSGFRSWLQDRYDRQLIARQSAEREKANPLEAKIQKVERTQGENRMGENQRNQSRLDRRGAGAVAEVRLGRLQERRRRPPETRRKNR